MITDNRLVKFCVNVHVNQTELIFSSRFTKYDLGNTDFLRTRVCMLIIHHVQRKTSSFHNPFAFSDAHKTP